MKSLDILLESISDEEWRAIQIKVETKRAHQSASIFRAKRESAIGFSDWILKKNVIQGIDKDGSFCWVSTIQGVTDYHSSLELYNIYIRGDWEEYPDEDENE
jgi:hypothetical protein